MGLKVKKTAQQLIDEIFKPKGVTFQKCTESDALIYLEDKKTTINLLVIVIILIKMSRGSIFH